MILINEIHDQVINGEEDVNNSFSRSVYRRCGLYDQPAVALPLTVLPVMLAIRLDPSPEVSVLFTVASTSMPSTVNLLSQ
ncbi:hypothetical protein [Nitrosomonas sp.]|uniref:hypothetical protein n=1 Tax=Nitrosomonas sp. TaxID=42353 RepID=UPI0025E978DD|nr:hypothetical protein [Nitrosomonas sp.]